MSAEEENVIYASNVALVQSHDVNSLNLPDLLEQDFFGFTGDVNETVQLEVAETRVVPETLESRIESLFGCWIEAGDEDELLDELYKSRLYSK